MRPAKQLVVASNMEDRGQQDLQSPRQLIAKRFLPTILIACAVLFLMSQTLFADLGPKRAAVELDNQTGRKVIYQFKWGADAEWKDFVLQPDHNTTHSRRYDPKGVPTPYIRVMTAGGIDGGVYKPYTLHMGFDNKPQRYQFELKNNKVDLLRSRN